MKKYLVKFSHVGTPEYVYERMIPAKSQAEARKKLKSYVWSRPIRIVANKKRSK